MELVLACGCYTYQTRHDIKQKTWHAVPCSEHETPATPATPHEASGESTS